MKNLFLLVATAGLLSGPRLLPAQASSPDSSAIVIPSEIPLAFVSAAVQPEPGRQLSILHYTVKNNSGRDVTSFTVSAYVTAVSAKCLQGEGWTITEDIPSNSTRSFSTTLKNYVNQDSRLAVVFTAVRDEATTSTANAAQIKKALAQISGADVMGQSQVPSMETVQATTGSSVSTQPAAGCDPGFCTDARTNALAICLGENCQLGGFSCSQSACSYSFTCRCCTGGHCQ